ncbi:YbjN domain-containing protein [Oceanithermus sp.]
MGGGYCALLLFRDDPDQPDCESLQLYTAFAVDNKAAFSTADGWNYSYRFAKVYLDDDLDPVLESDLDLSGGVNLEGTLLVFL